MVIINRIAKLVSESVRDTYLLLREADRAASMGIEPGATPPEVVADWFEENDGTVQELGEFLEEYRQSLVQRVQPAIDVVERELAKHGHHDRWTDVPWRRILSHARNLVHPEGLLAGSIRTALINYRGDGSDWFSPRSTLEHLVDGLIQQIEWTDLVLGELMPTEDGRVERFLQLLANTYREAYDYISTLAQRVIPLLQ